MAKTLPTIRISVHEGDQEVSSQSFQRDVINIGKLARAQVRLNDENASRMHAVIEVTKTGVVEIADLNSTNGTFVNGNKITRQVLESGDQVQVGDTRLMIDIFQKSKKVSRKNKKVEARPLAACINPETYLNLPPGESTGTGRYCVEVLHVWNQTVLHAIHTETGQADISIGEDRKNTFLCSREYLNNDDTYTLIDVSDTGFTLNLKEGVAGQVRVADEVLSVEDAIATHGSSIALSDNIRAKIEINRQFYLVSAQELPQKPRTSFYKKLDLEEQAYTALSIALHLLFVFLMTLVPEEELIANRDHAERRNLMIQSIQVAEIERQEEKEEEVELEKEQIKVEKSKEKSKQVAVEKKFQDVQKIKKKKEDLTKLTQEERDKRNKEIAQDSGILKALNEDSLSMLNDPADDLLKQGQLTGAIIASADPNAPTVTSFQAFSGQEGVAGDGASDFLLPQGSVASGSSGTKGMVTGLDKNSLGKDSQVNAGKLKKKNRKVKVDILTPQVSGSYDKEAVRRVIRAQAGAIRWCYQQALQLDPNLGGKVVLAFIISPTGSVKAPKVKSNTIPTPSVGECIRGKSQRWKFPPPPDGGIVKVSYPFLFKAKN